MTCCGCRRRRLFESDGRAFVYLRTPQGFVPKDVKLVQPQRKPGGDHRALPRATRWRCPIPIRIKASQRRRFGRRNEGAIQMILLSDLGQAFGNLRAQKTRTFLTAHGDRVRSGLGDRHDGDRGGRASEESLRFIEQLGVRNILIDSRPAMSQEELQQRRRSSPGLSERDVRILQANIDAVEADVRAPDLASVRGCCPSLPATYLSSTECVRRIARSIACNSPRAGFSTIPTTTGVRWCACWEKAPR